MDIDQFLTKFEQKRIETGTTFFASPNAIRTHGKDRWTPTCPIEFLTERRGAYHWGPMCLGMTNEDVDAIARAADGTWTFDPLLRQRLLKAAGLPTS